MVARRRARLGLLVLGGVAIAATSGAAQSTDPRSCVSVDSSGSLHDSSCGIGTISADGRTTSFGSSGDGYVAGDGNHLDDLFAHDSVTGATVRISVDANGGDADGPSGGGALSADGRFVTLVSDATDLVAGDGNGFSDVFVRDRDPDGNGIFDEGNGVTSRVSVRSDGAEANGDSFESGISADGNFVVFTSAASNLVAGDRNGTLDIFVHNRTTGATRRMSVDSSGAEANGASEMPSISADGNWVAFASLASNLVGGDQNGREDVFVHDRSNRTTVRASVDSAGGEANSDSQRPQLCADGSRVAFVSLASNLDANDTNANWDVFLHDFTTATTELESCDSNGVDGNGASSVVGLSADGTTLAFQSRSTNLDPHDTDTRDDAYVRDLTTGVTALVSETCWLKSAGCLGSGTISGTIPISGDGVRVGFTSDSGDLVAGDTNGTYDAFVYDRSIPEPTAIAAPYGSGYPGTLGVPDLTSSAAPVFGTSLSITATNSAGKWTPAVLAVGTRQASIPTSAGGTLLVDAPVFFVEAIPPSGLTMWYTVPLDPALCGVQLDLQFLELDAGAQYGISFTAGLEWDFGN